jgi:hypothetical protein
MRENSPAFLEPIGTSSCWQQYEYAAETIWSRMDPVHRVIQE